MLAAIDWGSVPDWLTFASMMVVIFELWINPRKPHFGKRPHEDSNPDQKLEVPSEGFEPPPSTA